MTDNQPTESEFIFLHSALNTTFNKVINSQLSVHGISYTEYLIMHFLSGSPGKKLPRIQLAERVGISASGVTRLLAPMEKVGITEKERNPRDARMSLVKLSATGERVYAEAAVSFERTAKRLVGKLSSNQLDQLVHLLTKLL